MSGLRYEDHYALIEIQAPAIQGFKFKGLLAMIGAGLVLYYGKTKRATVMLKCEDLWHE